jgi:hypothetical protein
MVDAGTNTDLRYGNLIGAVSAGIVYIPEKEHPSDFTRIIDAEKFFIELFNREMIVNFIRYPDTKVLGVIRNRNGSKLDMGYLINISSCPNICFISSSLQNLCNMNLSKCIQNQTDIDNLRVSILVNRYSPIIIPVTVFHNYFTQDMDIYEKKFKEKMEYMYMLSRETYRMISVGNGGPVPPLMMSSKIQINTGVKDVKIGDLNFQLCNFTHNTTNLFLDSVRKTIENKMKAGAASADAASAGAASADAASASAGAASAGAASAGAASADAASAAAASASAASASAGAASASAGAASASAGAASAGSASAGSASADTSCKKVDAEEARKMTEISRKITLMDSARKKAESARKKLEKKAERAIIFVEPAPAMASSAFTPIPKRDPQTAAETHTNSKRVRRAPSSITEEIEE